MQEVYKHFMGEDGFVWFTGVVEDRNDTLYLGRLKVRCIGWHTDKKTPGEGIPTEDLPWADVVMPVTSASISGIGSSPTGVVPGTHVFGFFRDGKEAQEPVVLGTIGGIPERISNLEGIDLSKVINLGRGGTGPLFQYAILKEFIKQLMYLV